MRQLTRLDSSSSVEAAMEVLNEDGAVILERLASPETMALIESELEPHWEDIPYGDSDFIGFRTQRATRLIAISKGCGELATNPSVLGIIDELLLPLCKRYHLHATNGVRVGPSESQQMLHRDDELFRGYLPHDGNQVVTNVIWALSDFCCENGATRVLPGSHVWGEDYEPDENEFAQAKMPSGSVMIYLGSTFSWRRSQYHRYTTHRTHSGIQPGVAAPGRESVSGGATGCRQRSAAASARADRLRGPSPVSRLGRYERPAFGFGGEPRARAAATDGGWEGLLVRPGSAKRTA